MKINRVHVNESKAVLFRTGDCGSWIAEWPLHQGCNERYCFTGFLKDEDDPDHEYFIQYRVMKWSTFKHRQMLNMSITNLKSGNCYSCKKEESINMDEVGKVRTKSSIIAPDFEYHRWFLYARTEEFSFRLHLNPVSVSEWSADSTRTPQGIDTAINWKNRTFSLSDLAARGTLFFHQDDGATKMVRCEGTMWFEKEYGSS